MECHTCSKKVSRGRWYVTQYEWKGRGSYPAIVHCKECYYEHLSCTTCSKHLTEETCEYAHYSLKRGVKRASDPYCKECYKKYLKEVEGDLCEFCGCNSYGSIPCKACRTRQ
jgi:hypothetical protein